MAQVAGSFSWPKISRSTVPSARFPPGRPAIIRHASNSVPAAPQLGSYRLYPACSSTNSSSSRLTGAGVENAPPRLPDSTA